MAGGSKALGIVKSVPASQQEGTMKEQMTDFFIYTTNTATPQTQRTQL
jgi:hypothetical protein